MAKVIMLILLYSGNVHFCELSNPSLDNKKTTLLLITAFC